MEVRKWVFALIILSYFCFLPPCVIAQMGEYDIKAVFLSRIAEFVEWPEQTGTVDDSKPFVIVVIGNSPFGTVLDDVYLSGERKIKNRKVDIQYFSNINQIEHCDLLFISKSEGKKLDDILLHVKGKPILTVGDSDRFGEKGVHFNFYTINNKTRFEINEFTTTSDGFEIDFRLRKIGKVVGRNEGGYQ